MKKYPLCELVEDFSIYPRLQVSGQHVNDLAEALRAGAELPPVIIDKKTKAIVDGVHRCRAHRKVYGDDCQIEAVEKDFKNQGEMLLEAARLNFLHGRRMATADLVRCAVLAKDLKVSQKQLALACNVRMERLTELTLTRTATTERDTRQIPLKRTFEHLAGQPLNDEQQETNKHSTGMPQLVYVNQLISMLENDMLDHDNPKLMVRLKRLHELLEPLVGAVST